MTLRYYYGGLKGKRYELEQSLNIVVRTASNKPLSAVDLSAQSHKLLSKFETAAPIMCHGVEVLKPRTADGAEELRKFTKLSLAQEPSIRFAGRALQDPGTNTPVLYTENFFVKFSDGAAKDECLKIIESMDLSIKRQLGYATNAFFASAQEGTGQAVFEIAEQLLGNSEVELCHPELVREKQFKSFPYQWHLEKKRIGQEEIDAHANVVKAWELSRGEGTVVAVIDDGVDIFHEEFGTKDKIVAPRDVSNKSNNPTIGAEHGTACAGVACADGKYGAIGVAPKAKLIPIRSSVPLGSQLEADAFEWAVKNGADVINCSWGPRDGRWWDEDDPAHDYEYPLSDSTRLAIDYAVKEGRSGKGCVITWAAGNGNESVENDGWAKYDKVIAVAACNDFSKRSLYSDYGESIWCAFPSSHGDQSQSSTTGIWTTDISGRRGYNIGSLSAGDAEGKYTNSFGGTSSAAPGVAGVAALMIAANPELKWNEVKELIRKSCDKIDQAGGAYDANGHSHKYGFGRINAEKAVILAREATAVAAQ